MTKIINGARGDAIPAVFLPGTMQKVAFTGADAPATAIGAATEIVRVVATAACHINFNAAATATSMYLPANVPEYFQVKSGDVIHVIQDAAGGNLSITEMQ